VLVWGDSAEGIFAHGIDVETKLLGLVRISLPPSIHGTAVDPARRSGARISPTRA